MCDPVSLTVASIGTSLYAGSQQKKAANKAASQTAATAEEQRKLDAEHAANIKIQAGQEINKIRAASLAMRGTQMAQQAASGVLVGSGSTQAMVDETIKLSEQDAYITYYNGEQGYLKTMTESSLMMNASRAQAQSYKDQGQASLLSGFTSAFATGANYFMNKA